MSPHLDIPSTPPHGIPMGSPNERDEWSTGEPTVPRMRAVSAQTRAVTPTRRGPAPRGLLASLAVVTGLMLLAQVIVYSTHPAIAVWPDSTEYLARAAAITHQGQLADPRRVPGYPLLLAAIFFVTGGQHLKAVVAVQTLLTALTVYEIYLLSWRLARQPWVAGAVAALVAVNVYFIDWQYSILVENFSTWLVVTLFLLAERLVSAGRSARHRAALVSFTLVSVVLILTGPLFIYLPALLLIAMIALTLWRKRERWKGRAAKLALSLALIYACVAGYMVANSATSGYFGLSYTGSVNMFGRIMAHHLDTLSVSPSLQPIQRNLIAFERTGGKSPWVFAERYGYGANNYSALSRYANNVVERHPVAYALAALQDIPTIWQPTPRFYAVSGGSTALTLFYHLGLAELLSYLLLPVVLLWLIIRLWRKPDDPARQVELMALLAVVAAIALLSVSAFDEYYRLREPLDWGYYMVVALAAWDLGLACYRRLASGVGAPGSRAAPQALPPPAARATHTVQMAPSASDIRESHTMRYLVTGGAGFLGSQLCESLARQGHEVVILDRVADDDLARRFRFAHADLRSPEQVEEAFRQHGPFDGVFHVAAMLAHAIEDKRDLVDSNVGGTRNIAEASVRHAVPHMVYTSSNCVVGKPFSQPVREDDPINPLELYGVTKWEGEKILAEYQDRMHVSMIRPPTIMGGGRLGLLSILYEFIYEGRKVWVLGKGDNQYQFIYAPDLIDAMQRAIRNPGFHLYNIGSDHVPSLRELYNSVIKHAGTKARVASLPKAPAVAAMRALHLLGMSPLGPYHYKMLAEDFIFDTSRIKRDLGWMPTRTNTEMLIESYDWYVSHLDEIYDGGERSAHRQPVKLQALALVKRLS